MSALPAHSDPPLERVGAFRARIHSRPDAVWVHAAGELDIASVGMLDRLLSEAQAGTRLVVLDLEELTFMAGCGARAVADAAARGRAAGRRFMVLPPPAHLRAVFELTGLAPEIGSPPRRG